MTFEFDITTNDHPLAANIGSGTVAVGDGRRILFFDHPYAFNETPPHIEISQEFGDVRSLCFSGNGKRLCAGMKDGSVVSYDPVECTQVEVLTRHVDPGLSQRVRCVDVSFDAGIVVSGSADHTVRVCRGQNRFVGRAHTNWVNGIALLKGDETFVSGSHDRTLRVWDLECTCLRVVEVGRWIWSLALSPCKTAVAAGQMFGFVTLFSTETWAEMWEREVHQDCVNSVAFHGRYLATGSDDATAKILDANTGRVIKSFERGHEDDIFFIAFTPSGTSLITTDLSTLRVWPLHPEKIKQLASFFAGSNAETMFDDVRDHHTLEESQGEAYCLAKDTLIPMIKRPLFDSL